jgi:hypothetical protein
MPTPRERLIATIVEALRDTTELGYEDRAERILSALIQPSLHDYALTVLASSDEALGTHLDLLEEWYRWWTNPEYLSATLPNKLHSRTWTALAVAGRNTVMDECRHIIGDNQPVDTNTPTSDDPAPE